MTAPVVSLVERLRNGGQPDLADMAEAVMDSGADAVGALRAAARAYKELLDMPASAVMFSNTADRLMAALVEAAGGLPVPEEPDDDPTCTHCQGTGESGFGGTGCLVCRGTGQMQRQKAEREEPL